MAARTFLLLVVLLLAACGGQDRAVTVEPAHPSALERVDWQLTHAREGGRSRDLSSLDAVLRVDGKGKVGGHGCNHFGADVEVTAGRIKAGGFSSTQMACTGERGEVDDLITDTLTVGASWRLEDGTLTLSGDGRELDFRERDVVFPTRDLTPIVEGEIGDAVYRLGWSTGDGHVGVQWESRDQPGTGFSSSGIGRPVDFDVTSLDPNGATVAGTGFVYVPVPLGTARAVWVPERGEEVALEQHELPPAGTWRIAAGLVDGPTRGGRVVIYDDDDHELMRSRVLPY